MFIIINYQQFILLSLTASIVSSRDLINFNVYQVGSRIFGDFKLPSIQIDSDFHFEQPTATSCNFNFNSHEPNRFDLNGEGSISDDENGVTTMSSQLVSSSARTTINISSKLNPMGQLTSAKIDFNVTDLVIGTYMIEVNEVDKCAPYLMKQNLTTNPPGLINYHASVRNLCHPDEYGENKKHGEQYKANIDSSRWPWINSTFDHYLNRNSTDVHETFNFSFDQLGALTGTSGWTQGSALKMSRSLMFISKINRIPSFRVDKMIEGGKISMTFEPISPFPSTIRSIPTLHPVNPHADDPSIW